MEELKEENMDLKKAASGGKQPFDSFMVGQSQPDHLDCHQLSDMQENQQQHHSGALFDRAELQLHANFGAVLEKSQKRIQWGKRR